MFFPKKAARKFPWSCPGRGDRRTPELLALGLAARPKKAGENFGNVDDMVMVNLLLR